MQIHDDENFGADTFNRWYTFPSMILGVDGVMSRNHVWIERAGGEIRIEVSVTATLNPNNGTVTVFHDTKLYEGASENSGDIDGQGSGSTQVVLGGQQTMRYGVNNTDEGGDWVTVSLVCTNSSIGRSML
jgi:hypothetical protein